MINTQDQDQLFKLIADYLKKDLTCIAIGGTAMMFMGYKNTTKDIDLVFSTTKDKDLFIQAIQELGYKEKTLTNIYDEKRTQHKTRPVMYTRGDERFDLFVNDIFGYKVTKKEFVERRDYLGKKELTIKLLDKEELILLKAITRREKDHEDIITILTTEKDINWEKIIDLAIQQKEHNEWILIDLEETLQQLKDITFIPQKHFKKIYSAQTRNCF